MKPFVWKCPALLTLSGLVDIIGDLLPHRKDHSKWEAVAERFNSDSDFPQRQAETLRNKFNSILENRRSSGLF